MENNLLEELNNTKGWEAVAKPITDIVRDFQQKKEKAEQKQKDSKENKNIKSFNDRIAPSKKEVSIDYKVPHFMIRGNPGVGKTEVAKKIGKIFYDAGILKKGSTIVATKKDLISEYVGATAPKIVEKINEAEESVLFIDEAYSLYEKGDEHNYAEEAITEIVQAMTDTERHFCLIMAGYPNDVDKLFEMNPGLRRRFTYVLTIEDYKPELLKDIFIKNCKDNGYRFWGDKEGEEEPLDLDLFFKNLYDQRDRAKFGNAGEVIKIAEEVQRNSSLRDDEERCIKKEDFAGNVKYFEKHGVSSLDDIYAELDKYVGFEFVKKIFEDVRLNLKSVEEAKKRGVKPKKETPDHFIFVGNPGTGKTTVGKMMGSFYHLIGVTGGSETIFVDASDLIGEHVGESKNKTLEKIQEAIDHNSVLYIDEAYQITESAYSSEIIGSMMTKMTENAADFKMIFGMYKNKVDDFLKLNSGLKRRVRIVEFPDYNSEQLVKIFDNLIKSQKLTINEEAHRLIEILMEYKYNTKTDQFGNAGEVEKLVQDMTLLLTKRTEKADSSINPYEFTKDDIPEELLNLIKDKINPRSFEDIMKELNEQIGLGELKDIVLQKRDEVVFAKKTKKKSLYDIQPGYYFFVGNPGTGKTTSAKLFAEVLHELGVVKTNNFYSCTAKDLIGQYVGQTGPKTFELLEKSRNGVLFIDEVYSLAYSDSDNGSSFKKDALEQIIAFMDVPENRKTCCFIFAGYEEDMQGLYESNSGMSSKIDEQVHFHDYSPEEMFDIFALFCRKEGIKITDGVKEHYIPIFEQMKIKKGFANGRTARQVFEETEKKLMNRVVSSNDLTEVEMNTIQMDDLLSEEECYKILS